MLSKIFIFFSIFLFSNMIGVSCQLNCFTCPSVIGESDCIINHDEYGVLQECEAPWDTCYKKTTEIDGIRKVDRGCTKMPTGLEGGECERLAFSVDTYVETICYCTYSECNKAMGMGKSMTLCLLVFAMAALF